MRSLCFICIGLLSIRVISSVILGRAIKNEYLALGTLIGTVGLSVLAAGGGKKDAPAAKPTLEQVKDSVKIDASSKYVVPRFLYMEMGIY